MSNLYEKKLEDARSALASAMMLVQAASTLAKDFDKSKPLNVLYKELRAHYALLNYYTGATKQLPNEGYEVATPQSIHTYINLNVLK